MQSCLWFLRGGKHKVSCAFTMAFHLRGGPRKCRPAESAQLSGWKRDKKSGLLGRWNVRDRVLEWRSYIESIYGGVPLNTEPCTSAKSGIIVTNGLWAGWRFWSLCNAEIHWSPNQPEWTELADYPEHSVGTLQRTYQGIEMLQLCIKVNPRVAQQTKPCWD